MDVVTAFLNGELEEEVYMEQAQGFETRNPKKTVCKLNRAIYELKRAHCRWHVKINTFLVDELNFKSNSADECVYILHRNNQILTLALYVDDILLGCSDPEMLQWLKAQLSTKFKMKDLGEARTCLV